MQKAAERSVATAAIFIVKAHRMRQYVKNVCSQRWMSDLETKALAFFHMQEIQENILSGGVVVLRTCFILIHKIIKSIALYIHKNGILCYNICTLLLESVI